MNKYSCFKKCMVFICVILMLSAFCVFAEGEVTKLSVVPTVEGNEVSVTVDYESSVMGGGSFNLVYDKTALRVVSAEAGDVVKDALNFINSEYAEDTIRMNWVFTTEAPLQGRLINIKFEIVDGNFKKSHITLKKLKIADADGNELESEFEIVYEDSEQVVDTPSGDAIEGDINDDVPENDTNNDAAEGNTNNNAGSNSSDTSDNTGIEYTPNTGSSSGVTSVTKTETETNKPQEVVTEQITTETVNPEPETEIAFTDVQTTDWFYENVKYAVEHNLMKGVSETEFAPGSTLTRAMLVAVLYRNEGEPAVNNTASFDDVDSGAYYAKAVSWAKENGIVNGVTETEFAPDANIIREQIAAIMYRYAKYKGYDVSAGDNADISSYTDAEEISGYATDSVRYVVGSGLMKGKSLTTLNPGDNATRAEIAAILQRFIENNK